MQPTAAPAPGWHPSGRLPGAWTAALPAAGVALMPGPEGQPAGPAAAAHNKQRWGAVSWHGSSTPVTKTSEKQCNKRYKMVQSHSL